jgi:hypothetical protein
VESDFLGARVSEELVPGGSRIAVTNDNVLQVSARGGDGGAGCTPLLAQEMGFCMSL